MVVATSLIACSGGAATADSGGFGELDPSTTRPEDATGATADPSAELTDGETSSDGDDDPPPLFDVAAESDGTSSCADAIQDTLEFEYTRTIEVGVETLQAGFYDTVRDEITVLSFHGQGRVLDVDGNVLREVSAPPEALPALDGAAYDAARDVAMLIRQDCTLVDVDPATMTALATYPLAEEHGISICAGIAIARNGDLYIASYGTNELVVLSRDDRSEVLRRSLLDHGFSGIDGIAEIAGSDNFIINSTTEAMSMIVDDAGASVVSPDGFGQAPLAGGGPYGTLDSMLTICNTGHIWLCDEYGTSCSDFAPAGGDTQTCDCLVAG